MAAEARHHLVFLLLGAAVAAAASAAAEVAGGNGTTWAAPSPARPTAYEMLERYHFPRGILPEGVKGYVLRPDGSFEVYFPRECEFLLAGQWLVRYDARVAGTAADGALRALRGVSVKVLFLWVAVGEVDRAGEHLSFYVGPISKSFPLSVFAESPRCRGYDHGDGAAAASR